VGATQVLPTLTGMRNAAFLRNYWKFCEREGVTALACVPTILASLCNLAVDADISRIRVAYTGGSPLPTELAARFEQHLASRAQHPGHDRDAPAWSRSSRLPRRASRARAACACRTPKCAWCPGATARCASKNAAPAAKPAWSSCAARTSAPATRDPARDAGMFEGGWLVSGDLGHIDAQGYVHVTGRAKDVIIRGSHNIDPGLVEDAFLAHPAVAMCAVVAEPDAHAGEVPAAFVTLKPGQVQAGGAAGRGRAHVYERPAVPKRVVVLPALPLTAIGKVYKPALRVRATELKLREVLGAVAP
jgi:fatty-acyl-CoA synthase